MVDWLKLSNDTIKKGLDGDNNRYLVLFKNSYLKDLGINISTVVGCGNCIDNHINRYKSYLKSKKMEKLNNNNPNTVLVLKAHFSPREIAGKFISNETLTNKDVLFVLEKHPTGAWFLEDFHKIFTNKDPNIALQDAIDAVKKAIEKEREDKKDGKKKKELIEEL